MLVGGGGWSVVLGAGLLVLRREDSGAQGADPEQWFSSQDLARQERSPGCGNAPGDSHLTVDNSDTTAPVV